MKKLILITIILYFNQTYGQIGKSYSEIQMLYPTTIIALRNEGYLLVEDKQVSKNEVRMIMYNKDSIAVLTGIGYHDSSLTDSGLTQLLDEEWSQFIKTHYAKKDGQLLWLDSINNRLVVLNPAHPGRTFPLAGIAIVADPGYIQFWVQGITAWKRE
ncbi:MAG: hypothetical protein JNM67_07865 [Bacteroidetes bacterium]|nr:hypothetical protein [Bacteroidota bacterium]